MYLLEGVQCIFTVLDHERPGILITPVSLNSSRQRCTQYHHLPLGKHVQAGKHPHSKQVSSQPQKQNRLFLSTHKTPIKMCAVTPTIYSCGKSFLLEISLKGLQLTHPRIPEKKVRALLCVDKCVRTARGEMSLLLH
jgi:hypothetical protein